jgi:hypothetical protein
MEKEENVLLLVECKSATADAGLYVRTGLDAKTRFDEEVVAGGAAPRARAVDKREEKKYISTCSEVEIGEENRERGKNAPLRRPRRQILALLNPLRTLLAPRRRVLQCPDVISSGASRERNAVGEREGQLGKGREERGRTRASRCCRGSTELCIREWLPERYI